MNINALLAQLDGIRRTAGQNVRNALTSPVAHLQQSLSRYAHENLPTRLEMQDARSVMPGMGNAMMDKVNDLATNSLGGGILAGRGAKTANLDALDRARTMAASGVPRERIWQETGWFEGPEKRWKFEIPDDVSRMRRPVFGHPDYRAASDVMKHDDLFAAYPNVGDIPTKIREARTIGGIYDRWPFIEARGPTPNDARSAMLHELQHAVQAKEGFASGGNAMTALGQIQKPVPKHYEAVRGALNLLSVPKSGVGTFDEAIAAQKPNAVAIELAKKFKYEDLRSVLDRATGINIDPYEAYKRLAGEAEARAVQSRADMTAQERQATPPWQSYDVPIDKLFVTYD